MQHSAEGLHRRSQVVIHSASRDVADPQSSDRVGGWARIQVRGAGLRGRVSAPRRRPGDRCTCRRARVERTRTSNRRGKLHRVRRRRVTGGIRVEWIRGIASGRPGSATCWWRRLNLRDARGNLVVERRGIESIWPGGGRLPGRSTQRKPRGQGGSVSVMPSPGGGARASVVGRGEWRVSR